MIRESLPPGVHDISAERYHADPCDTPGLSASLAKTLTYDTPLHAWTESRRLNPFWQPPADQGKFDIGTAAHELITGKGRGICVLPFRDYKTAKAKDARDQARANGQTPVLEERAADLEAMMLCARIQLDAAEEIGGNPFPQGQNEMTLIWERDGVLCRAMADCLVTPRRICFDYKATGGSSEPRAWVRAQTGSGIALRASHYLDGLGATLGPGWRYVFVVQENADPFLLSLVELSPGFIEIGDRQAERARTLWRRGTTTGHWPGQSPKVEVVEPPPWHEADWLDREVREAQRERPHPDLIRRAMQFQAPH